MSRSLFALLVAFVLHCAACSGKKDDKGTTQAASSVEKRLGRDFPKPQDDKRP